LAITGATIIDIRDGSRTSDTVIVIDSGKIAAVGRAGETQIPSGARIVDARGKYVIPGLWDVHTHIQNQRELEIFFPLFIAHGVVGIRDMDGLFPSEFKALGSKQEYVPQVVASGKAVAGPTPAGAADASIVDELADKGVDYIKIYSLVPRRRFLAIAARAKERGLHIAGHIPISVTALEASDAGLRTMEHLWEIYINASTRESELRAERLAALDKPMSIAERELVFAFPPVEPLLSTWSDEKASALFGTLAADQVWQTPTLLPNAVRAPALSNDPSFWNDPNLALMPRHWVDAWRPERNQFMAGVPAAEVPYYRERMEAAYRAQLELTRRMHEAGVGFLAGTDTSNWNFTVPGISLHDELARFVDAGFTPLQALQTATINPAKYLGIDGETGTIEPGKRADLLILDADPTETIANTKRIFAVVLRGSLIDRNELDSILAAARQRASEPPAEE
jgi:hypothetical protein